MRIIAAEVAIAPQGHPEVEVAMHPLDLDLPGPPPGTRAAGVVIVRLTLHTSRGDLTIRQPVALVQEEPLDGRTNAPADLPQKQYEALLRSVEQPEPPDPAGFRARLPRRPMAPSDHTTARITTDVLERVQERWAHARAPG